MMNPTAVNAECKWLNAYDVDGDRVWITECGSRHYFLDDGTPKENHYYYCPFCGGDIIQIELEDE